MRRGLLATLLLSVAFTVCPDLHAKGWREALNDHVGKGQVARIDEVLTDARLESTSESGNGWVQLVGMLERYGPFLVRQDAKTFDALIGRVLARAKAAQEENPKNSYRRAAWALAVAAQCRARVALGLKKAQPEWRAAADCMAALYAEYDVNEEFVGRAVAWLGEAAAVRAEKADEHFARAKEILDAVAKRKPDEEATQVAVGRWYVARARAAAARKSKGMGKAAVTEGLAFLKPHMEKPRPAKAFVTLHSALLIENEGGKFGVKEEVRTKTINRPADGVTFLIPDSEEWEISDTSKGASAVAVQKMHGTLTRRVFSFQSWKGDGKLWADQSQTISVDVGDPKELATAMLQTLEQYMAIDEVAKRHRPKKAKLCRDFKDVWHIRVEGTTDDGRWVMAHAYYFKPKDKKKNRTYSLTFREFQREAELDAAAQFVLDNLRLKEKR